jgi:hypothetical protein
MGKLIQFPCNDSYEEEESYYLDEFYDIDQCEESSKENYFKSFIRKLLLFVLSKL